jgi:hypothetical protein
MGGYAEKTRIEIEGFVIGEMTNSMEDYSISTETI